MAPAPTMPTRTASDTVNGTTPKERPKPSRSSTVSSPGGDLSEDRGYGGPEYDATVIPPTHDYRTLVVCYDGTGDQFDDDNSNIVQFFSMLKKDDRSQQMVYYQAGIGTYTIPQIATPAYAKFSKTMDMAIAQNLDAHVMGGYEFLMEHYQAMDKICIFGFSRGAYTARALAGMIHKVGLLPASNKQQVPFAYKMFTSDNEKGWKQSTLFKKTFSVDVEIEFIGVWDTVASVGLFPRHLPFTTSNTAVRYFRHAIALDEHRVKFRVNHFQKTPPHIHELGTKPGEMPRSNQKPKNSHVDTDPHNPHSHAGKKPGARHLEREYSEYYDMETDVKEVWFAGCHCDVGGGSVKNGTRHSLARIPLRWMIRECFRCKTGIQFHRDLFKYVGIDPDHLYPFVCDRPPPIMSVSYPPIHGHEVDQEVEPFGERGDYGTLTEEEEDLRDALCPMYDQLQLAWGWWLLEYLPMKVRSNKPDRLMLDTYTVNMGYPREIPKQKKQGINIHRSVQIRMEAEKVQTANGKPEKYTPRPDMEVDPTWVE